MTYPYTFTFDDSSNVPFMKSTTPPSSRRSNNLPICKNKKIYINIYKSLKEIFYPNHKPISKSSFTICSLLTSSSSLETYICNP